MIIAACQSLSVMMMNEFRVCDMLMRRLGYTEISAPAPSNTREEKQACDKRFAS